MDCSHQSSWPDRLLSIDRGKAVDELLRGRHVANQLWSLLGKRKSPASAADAPAEDLVVQILKSFAATISVLNSSESSESESDEVSQVPVAAAVSEDSSGGDSCKSTSAPPSRRGGCYKKRKTENTYTKVTTDLIDDGYAWRKYGQKTILRSDFPRNYFRCTHKYDKPGCLATKQVQQMSNDPPTFRTTYQNHHTCNNFLKPPQFVFEPTPKDDSSTMVCFQTNTTTSTGQQQDCRNYNNTLFSSSCFASTSTVTDESKEEIKKEEIKCDDYGNGGSQPSDYYMTCLPELVDQLGSSDQNGTSCATSSHGFEFDDVCNFDFGVDEAYYHYP